MSWFAALALLVAAPAAPDPAASDPAIEAQRATAERVFLEKMGQGKFEISHEIYAPGFRARTPGGDYDIDADNASGAEWRRDAPDLKVVVVRTVVEGDLAAVHWQASGTNSVAAAGLPGAGKPFASDGMTFFRFEGGRIAEE
jgi:hypothetical protein